ncbi:acyl-CoA dehydrogenase family protein [Piscinibacter sakaiensis]|uniref:Acyl-CoA dehydrogenase, short-chain specific n=1 Tax=Piscinibacter sakaiensis TaxID=1547922 RepID=A0A0K8NZN7_PISS1|nr:acyl-CoA dehydrogenase family protein [Piscinibacter sakaiensis]GAP35846.1 acyl-CoA dehydrogenase, short-chain specific [Piscinibacter sakaiensis]
MDSTATDVMSLTDAMRRIARDIAAPAADDVDARARFPEETLNALRRARLLGAPVPTALGGAGLTIAEQGALCAELGQHCSNSAMVLAMHYNQLACLTRHHADRPELTAWLRAQVEHQWLIGSMTSEVGTFGDTRSSICAVETDAEAGRFRLVKEATTGSYCAQADAILVTARRTAESPASDQVLVLLARDQLALTQTTTWDTLGMRGTCSPGFRMEGAAPLAQVLPVPYADISAQTMLPYSHILWASLWWGIAAGAHAKAAAFVRGQARKAPGTVPPTAQRLAELNVELQAMGHQWRAVAADYDATVARGADAEFGQMGWALKLNALKISASDAVPRLVHGALQIVGILGYKNDSPFSLGRPYRDALSASLMVSNERIASKSAAMLLVYKDS